MIVYKQIIFDINDDEELKNYMEDYELELKGNKDKNVSMKKKEVNVEELVRQICGFLNTKGGSIFVGIHDDSTVQGIELKGSNLDDLKHAIQSCVLKYAKITPPSENDLLFYFHKVVNPKKGDLYVLEILIKDTDHKDYRLGQEKKRYKRLNGINKEVELPGKISNIYTVIGALWLLVLKSKGLKHIINSI
ncbi:hypothetical protein ACTFIY_008461 [Dictyostelium cf. discoideum]